MADFLSRAVKQLPRTLEEAEEFAPRYDGWKKVQNFEGQTEFSTAYDNEKLSPTSFLQAGEDKVREYTKRSIVTAAEGAGSGNFNFNIRDYGIRPPVSPSFIKNIKVPPAPWAIKLEFSPGEIQQGVNTLLSMSPSGGLPMMQGADGQPVFDPQGMAEWSLQAATNYIDKFDIDVDPKVLSVLKSDVMQNMPTILKQLPQDLHGTTQDIVQGVSQISAVSVTKAFDSIDWSSAGKGVMLTMDSLQDGRVTSQEAANIGASTGAFAGGAVGSVFGPAGTAIGSVVGTLVGEFIGSISGEKEGINKAALDSINRREGMERKARKQQKLAVELRRQKWISDCQEIQSWYYESLQEMIRQVSLRWTELEVNTGWRFDLRWFDPNPGINFYKLVPRVKSRASHINAEKLCSTEVERKSVWVKNPDYYQATRNIANPGRIGMSRQTFQLISDECHLLCPHTYGCPYPKVETFDPVPVPGAYDSGFRAAAAFAARGFHYRDIGNRKSCEELAGKAGGYTFDPVTTLDYLALQMRELTAAFKLILFDIERTAISVQTEHDLWANETLYKLNGIDTGVIGRIVMENKEEKQRRRRRDNLLFYGGIGAVAAVLLGRR